MAVDDFKTKWGTSGTIDAPPRADPMVSADEYRGKPPHAAAILIMYHYIIQEREWKCPGCREPHGGHYGGCVILAEVLKAKDPLHA